MDVIFVAVGALLTVYVTVSVSVEVLFARSGSDASEVTTALFVIVPVDWTDIADVEFFK